MKSERVIKFRCWDGEKMHVYKGHMSVQSFGISIDGLVFFSSAPGVVQHDAILMQFTGLKDKNGAEIYEGDITEVYWYRRAIEWSDKDAGFMLRWCHSRGHEIRDGLLQGGLTQYWIDEVGVEVIGNIYEHSHLLTALETA